MRERDSAENFKYQSTHLIQNDPYHLILETSDQVELIESVFMTVKTPTLVE